MRVPQKSPSAKGSKSSSNGRFNQFIVQATEDMFRAHRGRGYDIGSYFTHNLNYGPDKGVIRSNHPPKTMCVAAVGEVIIEALNIYYAATSDGAPFQALPHTSWNNSRPTDIRPYIFMHDGTGSSGTASALAKFSMGAELPFEELLPGDFINFDRASGSGHAVVFLGFIDADGEIQQNYSGQVVGFKYFSAQGKGKPDAGLGFRWAYFDGFCPPPSADRPRDCGIIKTTNQKSFNAGYIFDPSDWKLTTNGVVSSFLNDRISALIGRDLTPHELSELRQEDSAFHLFAAKALSTELSKKLPPQKLDRYDGVTID